MQHYAPQGHMEGLITDWCAANGFGSDPVTVSTFTELASRLINALPSGLSNDEIATSVRPTICLTNEDLVTESSTDPLVKNNLPSPFAKGKSLGADTLPGATTPEQNANFPADEPHHDQSPATGFFLDASGDWRAVCHNDDWWAVGHHFVYPTKGRDHAERRCQELRKEYHHS